MVMVMSANYKRSVIFKMHLNGRIIRHTVPEHSVAVIFWNGHLPTAIRMSFQRNVKETTMLYMYFALTCNWTERSRSPWTMGLNLSVARHSPAVVMASRTFSKLKGNMECIWMQFTKVKRYGSFEGVLTMSSLLLHSIHGSILVNLA